jgi:hypothetical protein
MEFWVPARSGNMEQPCSSMSCVLKTETDLDNNRYKCEVLGTFERQTPACPTNTKYSPPLPHFLNEHHWPGQQTVAARGYRAFRKRSL